MICALAPNTSAENVAQSSLKLESLTLVESISRTASLIARRSPRCACGTIAANKLAEHLPGPLRIGIRQRRALHWGSANVIEPRLVARHPGYDLPQARSPAQLAVQQGDDMPLRVQLARQPVGAVLLNRSFQSMPRNALQYTMKYAILVQHGVVSFPCLERVRSAQNTEESTSCTLSTKNQPDKPGHDVDRMGL